LIWSSYRPFLLESFSLLLSIPGIGEKTALTLISEYGASLSHVGPKQFTRYAGLDIVFFQSGSSVYRLPRISKQASKQANWRIRRALSMAALSAIRHNPVVRAYYLKLVASGRPKKSALMAAMRKLLHQCYGILKKTKLPLIQLMPNYTGFLQTISTP
jgi:transposase